MKKILLLLIVLLPIFAAPAHAFKPRHDDYSDVARQYDILKDRYAHVLDMRDRYGANVRINDKIGRFDNLMHKLKDGLGHRDADPRKLRDMADTASDMLTDIEGDLRSHGSYEKHDYPHYKW